MPNADRPFYQILASAANSWRDLAEYHKRAAKGADPSIAKQHKERLAVCLERAKELDADAREAKKKHAAQMAA